MKAPAFLLALLATVAAHAGPRTSANYSIATDTTDAGGQRATSAAYTNDGSAGGVAGLSSVASPAQTAKSGYVGQLYDVTGLVLNSAAPSVNETATLQLAAWQLLDDESTLAVAVNSVAWSVVSGPVTGIDSGGLATADVVAQDTPATVQGMHGGFTGMLNLTVLDTIADNFGTYGSDGLPDDWQVQYFGPNNPDAGPGVVTDGSGLTNLFKYTAGLIPNNAVSTFNTGTGPVTGQPGQRSISFGPTFSDRNYTIKFSTDLLNWNTLSGPTAGNDGTMSFTDTNAGGPRKFYRVQIIKP